MAIRIWQPEWYKFWCDGVRWGYNPKNTYEDERNNNIKRTHRGYIIPNDSTLEVDPSMLWYIWAALVITTFFLSVFATGYYIYNVWGLIGLLLIIGVVPVVLLMLFLIYRLILLIIDGGCLPRDRL